jgi:transglutaminase-like putative cysteine protease
MIMTQYAVRHRTQYRYGQSVTLGRHRLMLRPRDSHDLRLLKAGLTIVPEPAEIRWLHDVYGNSVAVVEFNATADELVIESELHLDHRGLDAPQLPIEPFAQQWPFNYEPHEWPDLRLFIDRQYSDPGGILDRWVYRLLDAPAGELPTQEILTRVMQAIARDLPYRERYEEGVQPPLMTLQQGGTCRDFAVLMIEAVRVLGFAARFASGYLYVPSLDPGQSQGLRGGGATHAWVQVYLPGAGWVEFDPTNELYGGVDLLRVAVARDAASALPITGSFTGPAGVMAELDVDVAVEELAPPAAAA